MLEKFVTEDLEEIVRALVENVAEGFRQELEAQGHRLTGKLIKSIEVRVKRTPLSIRGEIYFLPYAQYLERGVKAANIPFSGRGGGGTSKYIQALIDYFQDRGLPEREATRAAFATAHVHAREGMPTRASRRFSRTGERTGFISRTVRQQESEIEATFFEEAEGRFNIRLTNLLKVLSV